MGESTDVTYPYKAIRIMCDSWDKISLIIFENYYAQVCNDDGSQC